MIDLDDLKFVGVLLLIFLSLTFIWIGVTSGVSIIYNQNYCETQQRLSPEYTFQWELWGGCLIQLPDGTWANADDWLNTHRLELEVQGEK